MTTPKLLALALNRDFSPGPHRCFYCGSICGDEFTGREFVADTFTSRNMASQPGSQFVCGGCVCALESSDRSKQPRLFSWVITRYSATSIGKGKIAEIRAACLAPPEPPYSIVVSASGQKHLIYLAPINYSRDVVTVQFELDRVTYRPDELQSRLSLCAAISAAGGKPSLADAPTSRVASALADYYADFDPLLIWFDIWAEPLSRLAAHLTPKMEDSRNDYPSTVTAAPENIRRGRVPATAGRTDGPGLFPD